MIKYILSFLILLFLNLTLYASVGNIKAIKGIVYLQNHSGQQNATVGMPLQLQDTISTRKNSSTSLLFKDQTAVTIGKTSTFFIRDYIYDPTTKENNTLILEITKGMLRTITGQIGKINPSKFRLKTKTASIGIRGTTYIIEIDGDMLKIAVENGSVFVEPFDPNIEPFIVAKGDFITFNSQTGEIVKKLLSNWKEGKAFQKESQQLQSTTTEEDTEDIPWSDSSLLGEDEDKGQESLKVTPSDNDQQNTIETLQNEVDNSDQNIYYKEKDPEPTPDVDPIQESVQSIILTGKHFGGITNSYIDAAISNVYFDGITYKLDYIFDWFDLDDYYVIADSKSKKKTITNNDYTVPNGLNYSSFTQIDQFSYQYTTNGNIYSGTYNVWADNLGEFVVTSTDSNDQLQDLWYAGVTGNYIDQPNTLFTYNLFTGSSIYANQNGTYPSLETSFGRGNYYYNNSYNTQNITHLPSEFYKYGAVYFGGTVSNIDPTNYNVYTLNMERYSLFTDTTKTIENSEGIIYGSNLQGIGFTTDTLNIDNFGTSTQVLSSSSQSLETAYLESSESYNDTANAQTLSGYLNVIKSISNIYSLDDADNLQINISESKDVITATASSFGSGLGPISFGNGSEDDHYYITNDLFGVKLNSGTATIGIDDYTASPLIASTSTLTPVTPLVVAQPTHTGELTYQIDGEGYIKLTNPNTGEDFYTKDLTFIVDEEGFLIHKASGFNLNSPIVIPNEYSNVSISDNGTITADNGGSAVTLGQLELYILYDNASSLPTNENWIPVGNNLYIPSQNIDDPLAGIAGTDDFGTFEQMAIPGGYMIAVPESVDGSDNYTMLDDESSWGYWTATYSKDGDNDTQMEIDPRSTWVAGTKTDPSIIQSLINGTATSINFKGHILGAVTNNTTVDPIAFDSNNYANFQFDFGGGNGNFQGNMGFNTVGGENWSANFVGTDVTSTKFQTSSIVGSGGGTSITAGHIEGVYYGSGEIKSIGGRFDLDNGSKMASGVFKAARQ
jgi:hypothetical protein